MLYKFFANVTDDTPKQQTCQWLEKAVNELEKKITFLSKTKDRLIC